MQWSKLFNNDIQTQANDIKFDNDGNIILAGASYNGSQTFALLIKCNSSGDTLWTKKFNNNQSRASHIHLTTDGLNNIYTVGNITQLGKCLITNYSNSGNLNWFTTFTYDVGRTNLGLGIYLDLNRDVYIIGTQVRPQFQYDSYLLKLNNIGTIQWDIPNSGYGTGNNSLWGPIVTSDGSSIYYTASVHDTIGNGYNISLYKINSTGILQWSRIFNGGISNGLNLPYNIKFDKLENIYIVGVGYFQNSGDDILALKYSNLGDLKWYIKYSGLVSNGGDYGNDIFIDTNMNVYLTGMSKKLNNSNFDATTIKYDQIIGINNYHENILSSYNLSQNYPNPFNPLTKIKFSIPQKSYIQLRIYDILGRLKEELVDKELQSAEYEVSFNGSNLASGSYFYQLIADNVIIETKKFVVIK